MKEFIAFIAAIIAALIFTAIFGAIIAVISTVIASWGLATYSVGGVLHTSGNIINIFLFIFIFFINKEIYSKKIDALRK